METTGDRGNQKQLTISPRTELLAVQPMAFQGSVTNNPKTTKQKFFNKSNALKGLHLANSENDNTSVDSRSFRGDVKNLKNNNNLPKLKDNVRAKNLEMVAGQVFPDFPAGEVNVSLSFDKATSRLKVHIVKARNLCCKAREGKRHDRCGVSCSDLYINVSLFSGQRHLQSHRTSKKKGSTDVLFYENCALDLASHDLRQLTLRLTAMHCCKYVINTDHVIGHVDTDDKSSESSLASHWIEVITCPGSNLKTKQVGTKGSKSSLIIVSCIAMNALVKEDAGCSDYVTQAINGLDGARGVDCHFPWQQSPRKFQQTHVIVACRQKKVLCYFPNQDKWKKLPDVQSESASLVSCRDKLYAIAKNLSESERYESLFNVWVPLVKTKMSFDPNVIVDPRRRNEMQVFVVRGEIYTVASNPIGSNTLTWKYDFDSNSWKSFPAFDWGRKDQVCVVPTEEYIYAIGGRKHQNPNEGYVQRFGFLSDVERFDTEEKTWEKLADIQVARRLAFGCTMQGQIFIAGGIGSDGGILQSCELYKILENEWQFISSLNVPRMYGSMMCVSGKLYVLGGYCEPGSCQDDKLTVECYDQENNQWTKTTMAPFERITEGSTFILLNACSAQLFNGVINTLNNIQSPESAHPTKSKSSGSRICRIM
ncbi:Synaptotagmin-9 [Desmophyllum pertusum]|uniref:Synaptotagmin-9 n=1 Tax=Desmophyllum pertusum TaxID=174260 RepID=A0A9W9YW96_9CNID|nr:Synaptotagmin-9 [Desmophyllum pertusum]